MKKCIIVKILKPFGKHEVGSSVKVEVDDSNIPLDRGWRRRLADAKMDKCCEVIKQRKRKKQENNDG